MADCRRLPPAHLAGFALRTLEATAAPGADDALLREIGGLGTERFAALNAALAAEPLLLEMAPASSPTRFCS